MYEINVTNNNQPITDISFDGDDLYCSIADEQTTIYKNNEVRKQLQGCHLGLSWPFVVNKNVFNAEFSLEVKKLGFEMKAKVDPTTNVMGCVRKGQMVRVSDDGIECVRDIKLQDVPHQPIAGVEFTDDVIITLWAKPSKWTHKWTLMFHDINTGKLISKHKAPLVTKASSIFDVFAKQYYPCGLSFKDDQLYVGYAVQRRLSNIKSFAIPCEKLFGKNITSNK